LPLVRDVALGVVMGNACDELKQAADYVSLSVDEDGVCHALRHYGLID
ncbi:MAG: HAD hydrolase family protein, partial [Alistipes sp.]|nr:HAD hydrolase family protein [Alistipes sp.]